MIEKECLMDNGPKKDVTIVKPLKQPVATVIELQI
jgi:hypothetical protein